MEREPPTSGTVLVVDDDQVLAELLVMVLVRAGYTALSAVDAAGAQALMESRDGISAIVCDFELGRDNGADLLRSARAQRPELHCILMSGHTDARVTRELPAGVLFLQKPFAATDLVRALEHMRTHHESTQH